MYCGDTLRYSGFFLMDKGWLWFIMMNKNSKYLCWNFFSPASNVLTKFIHVNFLVNIYSTYHMRWISLFFSTQWRFHVWIELALYLNFNDLDFFLLFLLNQQQHIELIFCNISIIHQRINFKTSIQFQISTTHEKIYSENFECPNLHLIMNIYVERYRRQFISSLFALLSNKIKVPQIEINCSL